MQNTCPPHPYEDTTTEEVGHGRVQWYCRRCNTTWYSHTDDER